MTAFSKDRGKNAGKPHLTIETRGMTFNKQKWLLWGLLGLFVLTAIWLSVWGFRCRAVLWGGACYYTGLFTDREWINSVLKSAGAWAPILFIVIQSLQVMFAPIPGEATGFLGGYLFGVPLGFLYSTIGLTLGSLGAFLVARWLEEHVVARWIPKEVMEKYDFLMERQGALISFILFLLPGFPKDYLCFVLGLSRMPIKLFLLIVFVGRIPGTLLLTLQGAKVYQGDYRSTGIILALCLVLVVVLGYYREAVYRWIRRFDHPGNESGTEQKSS
jgi:uncharacterized membrane protein YdjX (TVP38/TMEM64 family)